MPRGIRPSTTVSDVNKSEPFYQVGGCYVNAFINQKEYYAEKKLRLVIGSFAINGWFEFGGKDWTKDDFEKKMMPGMSDSHCWLEDAEGNVYDRLFTEYENRWVKYRTGKPMPVKGTLEGISKEDLKDIGIEYVPAPKDAQLALLNHHKHHMASMYKAWKNKSFKSLGNGYYIHEA